jgi:hypothetical protein
MSAVEILKLLQQGASNLDIIQQFIYNQDPGEGKAAFKILMD